MASAIEAGENMPLREFEGMSPKVAEGAYVDPSAILIGHVICEERSGVFPGAVLRADESSIEIGKGSFVLDLTLVEAPSGCPVTVGEGSIISHGAALHGCTVGDSSLVGIGAIVLERAQIGDRCIVAAGSLVPPKMKVEAGSVLMGSPAKKVRESTEDDMRVLKSEIMHLKQKIARYAQQSQ